MDLMAKRAECGGLEEKVSSKGAPFLFPSSLAPPLSPKNRCPSLKTECKNCPHCPLPPQVAELEGQVSQLNGEVERATMELTEAQHCRDCLQQESGEIKGESGGRGDQG